MKNFVAVALLFLGFAASAQADLNKYQYAIVPAKFSFMNERDKYTLNTYVKLYLQKYGFTAYLNDEDMPMELMAGKCDKVYVDLLEDNNMMATKLKVQFKDCLGNILYTTEEGVSRQKDFAKAYREALSKTFESFAGIGYKYDGTTTYQTEKDLLPTARTATSNAAAAAPAPVVVDKNTLFAQPTENGYQLVDSTPAVVFKLQKTSSHDVFLAQKGNVNGTLINKGNVWTFEYYQDGKLLTEQVKIKF